MEIEIHISKKDIEDNTQKWSNDWNEMQTESMGEEDAREFIDKGYKFKLTVDEDDVEFDNGVLSVFGAGKGYNDIWVSTTYKPDLDILGDVATHIAKILNKARSLIESIT